MKLKTHLITGSGCASSPDIAPTYDELKSCGGCMLCKIHLNTSATFQSTLTLENFSLPSHKYGIENACTTKNVVYLITRDCCHFQYVGMTTNSLRTRFNNHRSAIKNSKHNTVLYHHFLNPGHRVHHAKVQIIYHYQKDDDDAKDVLLTVEEFYMRKLGTLFPFGLNDNITSMNINLWNFDFVKLNQANTPFFTFGSERRKRSHGHRKKTGSILSLDQAICILDELFDFYNSSRLHDLFVKLRSLSQNKIVFLLDNLSNLFNKHPAKKSSLGKILLSYRSQFVKAPKKKDEDFIYCTIPFFHKIIEKIGIKELFNRKDLKANLPHSTHKFKVRTTYSYGPTVGKKLFNYNRVLSGIGVDDFSVDTCDCNVRYNAFVYPEHGHVHTGKLDIIENGPLKEVMSKGAKYRLTPSTSKSKIFSTIKEALFKFTKKLAKKSKLKEECFLLWLEEMLKKIDKRIYALDDVNVVSNNIFEQAPVTDFLKALHERFVIVPVDKAKSNQIKSNQFIFSDTYNT